MSVEIPEGFTEAYQVVDVFILEHAKGSFRVEVVKVLKIPATEYAAHYYQRSGDAWGRISGPGYVAAPNSELAAQQALGFLKLHLAR